ncbi:hypothetical protein [Mesorhizobium sp. INR15]|uniref:hypothetical protein n=1 Tax=Mesorhizobium sp. INR15 TaxID=2654248 RepID=UPI0018C1CBE2|nr:hypothetical protein [Mesorhizobium sp. INR15]QPC91002.1 hypothetical protein GA829_10605 [Mesorhizobium sp. INR15]
MLGGLVYWPIRESTNDLKAQDIETGRLIQSLTSETTKAIQTLAANTVTRQEMDWRAQRGIEDRNRMENRGRYPLKPCAAYRVRGVQSGYEAPA